MPEILLKVKEVLEKNCSLKLKKEVKFNSVLLNLYRNGRDSISFHSDDERELYGESWNIGVINSDENQL